MTTNTYRLLACVGFAALAASPAFAVTPDQLNDTVIVTGVAAPAEADRVGYAVTVIPEDRLINGGYSLVSDALRQAPGLAVNRTGPIGGMTQLRIRGAEGNHNLVLLDGVDLSAAGTGETDLATLLSFDLDRIEIVRGPQSGLYGSNALAGVVNLVTRREIDGFYVGGAAEAGSWNSGSLRANAGFGDGSSYAAGAFELRKTDGYDVSTVNLSVGSPLVPGDKEGATISNVLLRGGFAVSPNLKINAFGRYNRRNADLDGQAYSGAIAGRSFDDASYTHTSDLNAGASADLSLLDGRWTTTATASHTASTRDDLSFYYPSGFASPSGDRASRTGGALRSTIAFGQPAFASLLTGFVDAKEERYRNACPFSGGFSTCSPTQEDTQTRDLLGYGLQYRADIGDALTLHATLRHDDNADFGDADTWSVAGSWRVLSGTRLHASAGVGVTNPTFFEQFGFDPGSYVGNPNLIPEESEGWDIGVEQTLWNGRLVFDVTYFRATLDNEITTVYAAPLYIGSPINSTGKSEREGLETSFRLRLSDAFDLTGGYTWLDATEPAGVEVRRPEHSASLDATWRPTGSPFRFDIGVTHNGEQFDTDFSTFMRRTMDAYTLVRLGAAWQATETTELYVRGENLFDTPYEEVIGYRGAPQAVFVGVRFRDGTAK